MKAKIVAMASKCALEEISLTSPIGELTFGYCTNGLHSINQSGQPVISSVKSVELIDSVNLNSDHHLWSTVKWLQTFFTCPQKLSLQVQPIICSSALSEDTFRGKVRSTLLNNVQFGETISYGKLAELVGCKGGARAVGTAMSNNPLSLLVPCHRVIKSDGSLGNYGKGSRNEVKEWLLKFEEENS